MGLNKTEDLIADIKKAKWYFLWTTKTERMKATSF